MSAAEELDPSEFVQRIRQLGEQRDQQDAERVRKLEEEILQGRSERLARRAERARSLSPNKPSTPQQARHTALGSSGSQPTASSPAIMDPPALASPRQEALQRLTASRNDDDEPAEPAKPSRSSKPASTPTTPISRSTTLSWQQRRPLSSRRPLSVVASENNAARSPRDTPEPPTTDENTTTGTSRARISQTLGSKDPAWFKQTPDRGLGSAALRKTAEESTADTELPSSGRKLPGMARESQPEGDQPDSPSAASVRSSSPSRTSSVLGSTVRSNRFSSSTSISGGDTPEVTPRQEVDNSTPTMSPSQGRITAERPVSPTKGMGGFVQSAMLRRNDSVSKRWSAQTPVGLSRQNSTASNISGFGGLGGATTPKLDARPLSLHRGASVEPTSRPSSSHSDLTVLQGSASNKPEITPDGFVKPARPLQGHGRAKSITGDEAKRSETSPPPSPSKRWSPTKSSWLESALQKPDSPKMKAAPPQQPSWMAEINRVKQQRNSVDLSKKAIPGKAPATPEPVKASAPVTPKMNESAGTSQTEASATKHDSKEPEITTPAGKADPAVPSPKPKGDALGISTPEPVTGAAENSVSTPTDTPSQIGNGALKTSSPFTPKSRPENPVKHDFRANLKHRELPADKSKQEEPEFKNVFGKLKRAQTEKYVAPDELKGNILRGKAGLTATAGPQKGPRRDELRDSLIKQKEAIKAKAAEAGDEEPHKPAERTSAPIPEALAKRRHLSKTDSISSTTSLPKEKEDGTPEALLRQRSLKDRSRSASPEKNEPERSQPKAPFVRSSKLADRFNPALANMLARGPPTAGGDGSKPSSSGSNAPQKSSSDEGSGSGAQLTHMTKGRARGPKRRAPASRKDDSATAKLPLTTSSPSVEPQDADSSSTSDPAPKPVPQQSAFEPKLSTTANRESLKPKPETPKKSPRLSEKIEALISPSVEQTSGSPTGQEPSTAAASSEELASSTTEAKREDSAPSKMASSVFERKSASPAPEKKPAFSPIERKVASPVSEEKSPSLVTDKKPSSAVLDRKPSSPVLERKPSSPVLEKKPSSPVIEKKHPSPVAEKKSSPPPVAEKKPASPVLERKPSAPVLERKPSPPVFEKKPSSPVLEKKPSSPVLEKKPTSPVLEKKPASPVLEKKLVSPVMDRKAAFSVPERKPSPPIVEKDPSFPAPQSKPTPALEPTPSSLSQEKPISPPVGGKPLPALADKKTPFTDLSNSKPLSAATSRPTSYSSRPLPATPSKSEDIRPVEASPKVETAPKTQPPALQTSGGVSVKNAASMWAKNAGSTASASPPPRSPIKLPTKADERTAMENAGLTQPTIPNTVGLGIAESVNEAPSPVSKKEMAGSKSTQSSPTKSSFSTLARAANPPVPPKPSPPPQTSEAEKLFAEYFDDIPVNFGELPKHIDAQGILTSSPLDTGKIRTLRKQIQEITGDGKLVSVAAHEEIVLYEDQMFLCTHVFGAPNGAKVTEVYLWAGSGVPEGTLEDAQLFARKVAKDNSGKLIILRQGKETPNFFDALGGIVIVRRGSSPASQQYLLCGRRHLGRIAFDEVDLSLSSLCSGFPYIVSSSSGKVFLWKGYGCHADELSAARLMGMDLSTTGELIEIDEGQETPEFFDSFPTPVSGKKAVPRSADHWRYKASSDKYRARLYRFEQQQAPSSNGGLQVSTSSWPNLFRRPSWQGFSSPTRESASQQQTNNDSNSTRSSASSVNNGPNSATAGLEHTTVVEIAPFNQADLEAEHVYVLDAFFEIYIIVGALSRTQHHAFSTAMLFAQEYGILAAGYEDRPFVPVSTVVLEGIPRDMKAVFRRWDDRFSPTAALMSGRPPRRGKSLRIVGLSQALRATRK